jgi:N-6 DNA Methylase
MEKILGTLLKAQSLMPCSITHAANADILLTLLFWKLMSAWHQGKANRFQQDYHQPDVRIKAIMAENCLRMNESARYDSCHWERPEQACAALRDGLYRWHSLQSHTSLYGILRPERFGTMSRHYPLLSNSGVLADVITLIGGLSFHDVKPALTIGEIFSRAVDILQADEHALRPVLVQFMLDVLQPLPLDRIYDPACGNGQLLLACARDMAQRVPRHQMHLAGHEARLNQWALSKMQLLCHGLTLHQLTNGDALDQPVAGMMGLPVIDVVLTYLPGEQQDWKHAAAKDDRRFPADPPKHASLALIWHGLAQLQHESARMGVILPLHLLDGDEGMALRRYLIQQHCLEAVIELPGLASQGHLSGMLVLRHHHISRTVAFISGNPLISPALANHQDLGLPDLLEAYRAFRQLQSKPGLVVIDDATIARHAWSFHLAAYADYLQASSSMV